MLLQTRIRYKRCWTCNNYYHNLYCYDCLEKEEQKKREQRAKKLLKKNDCNKQKQTDVFTSKA